MSEQKRLALLDAIYEVIVEFIVCPTCQTRLGRVDHSPFSDDWAFYCDNCANRAEVSFYDPVVNGLRQTLPPPV